MKASLLIEIEVSEDGKHCGECHYLGCVGITTHYYWCRLFLKDKDVDKKRLSACLAAERKAKEK